VGGISSFVPNTIDTEGGVPRKVVVGHFFKPKEGTELCTSPVDVATEFSCDVVPAADEWVDFFEADFRALGVDVVIDNPPFSCIVKVLRKLFDSGIPFVLVTSQLNFQQVGVREIFHNDPNYCVVMADKSVTFKAGTEGKNDIAFLPMLLTYGIPMDDTTVDDYGHIWKGVDLRFKRYKPPPFRHHPVAKPFGKELLDPDYEGDSMFDEVHGSDYAGEVCGGPDYEGDSMFGKVHGPDYAGEVRGGPDYEGDSMFGEVHGPDYDGGDGPGAA
jgi:hypothetical protein